MNRGVRRLGVVTFVVALAAGSASGLGACSSADETRSITEPFQPTAATLTDVAEWRATGLRRAGGLVAPAAGTVAHLSFATDKTVSGSGGCNTLSSTYTVQGRSLMFGNVAQTFMACTDGPGGTSPTMAQDDALADAMARTTSFDVRDGALELKGADGTVQAAFRAWSGQSAGPDDQDG